MDGHQSVLFQAEVTNFMRSFLVIFIIFIAVALWATRKSKLKLPPGPWGLPILGYLPFLQKDCFRTLDNLSKIYGSVFSLYFGRTLVIILGDYGAVKEAFNKWETSDRPPGIFDFIPNGLGLFSNSGSEWVEQRYFTMKSLKKHAKSEGTWEYLIEEEVSVLLQLIRNHSGRPMNIFKLLTSSVADSACAFFLGKKLPFDDPNRKFVDEGVHDLMEAMSLTELYNYCPWLVRLMAKLNIGGYAELFAKAADFNNFMKKEVEQHLMKEELLKDDFISSYVAVIKAQQKKNPLITLNEESLNGLIKGLFFGATDSVINSNCWAMVAMAAFPDVQEKVHKELDSMLEEGQRASWKDRFKLPYTYAVLMECTRWRTVVPLNTSHFCNENMRLGEYDIPKGSTIIANNWAINNNPTYWTDPEKFVPERFLLNGGKEVNFRPEHYVVFSHGKRLCPGETMAMMQMFLYLTSVVQVFEIRTPNGLRPRLDGIMNLIYGPVPQEFCFLPRLPRVNAK